jgi:hypothetical protein
MHGVEFSNIFHGLRTVYRDRRSQIIVINLQFPQYLVNFLTSSGGNTFLRWTLLQAVISHWIHEVQQFDS